MEPLINALQERATVGRPVTFWLRDDDAVEPGESLNRLLELTETFSIPLTLAVIPAFTGTALAQRLDTTRQVSVAVHGWAHTNYASSDEKKQELGVHRPQSDVLAELRRGFIRLSELHHSRFVPLLVPPWNRISPDLIGHLSHIGFFGFSTFGDEKPADIVSINAQVDIIDWKGSRAGRVSEDLVAEIVTQLQGDRASIGILSHHLVHDEMAWQFLEQLFEVSSGHPGARWMSVVKLLDCQDQLGTETT